MRPSSIRLAGVFFAMTAAVVIQWACSEKSPTGPTPPAACTFSVAPSALSFGSSAGSAAVTVTTAAACAWTAASDRGWMTVASGASGAGPGTVGVSVTANAAADVRTGSLTVAGQAVAVRQDAATTEPCTIALSPSSVGLSKDAASGSFAVRAGGSCQWTAASTAGWAAITSDASGRGDGTVAYAVERNTAAAGRSGTIRVADAVFAISQAGDTGLCEFRVAPVEVSACMSVPHELSTTVTTGAACPWTATPDAPWITLAGGASRVGPGEVRFTVSDNYDPPRSGVLKLRWETPTAGQNVRVSQAGCRYAVSTGTISAPAAGGSFSFDVYQQSDPLECGGPLQDRCVWSASTGAAWIAISTTMPQSGDGRVGIRVAANAGPASRSAVIAVRDKTVTVVQAGS